MAAAVWQDQELRGPTTLSLPGRPATRLAGQVLSVAAVACLCWWLERLITPPGQGTNPLALVAAVLVAVPLLALPAGALLCWRMSTIGLVVAGLVPTATTSKWVVLGAVYLCVLLVVGLRVCTRTAVGAGLLTSAVCLIGGSWLTRDLADATFLAIGSALAIAAGQAVRTLLVTRRELAAQAAGREEDATQRAVLRERTRIARELHDVVAHHISMIAIQATAAPLRDPQLGEQSRATFALIEQTARSSLADMRRVIGVLRVDDATQGEREPMVGLKAVPGLVDAARAADQDVELSWDGAPDVPDAVGISAYRLVQEALTNARRHAPGAPVRVAVQLREGNLEVEVENGPPAPAWQEAER